MPDQTTKWGVVATIKAPAQDVLRFAAYHLDLGAHRLFIYLDEPNPEAYAPLKNHSKVRVFSCDDAFWKGGNASVRRSISSARRPMRNTPITARMWTGWRISTLMNSSGRINR